MKRFIQILSVMMAMAIFLATPAFAAEAVSPRASSFFMSSSVYFDDVAGSRVDVWFDVTALGIMNELGTSKIKVQKSTDLEDWTTVQTYYKEDYSQMTDTNTGRHADCVPFYPTDGYYYRAVVTLYAKNSSGSATMTTYTPVLDLT